MSVSTNNNNDANNNTKESFSVTIADEEDGFYDSMRVVHVNRRDLLAPILNFFKSRSCYDFMPNSCKVVVLDIELPVKEAFHAAVENDITFATLWDSREQALVGMLTVTDFIDILLHFHNRTNVIQELGDHQIRKWREMGSRSRPAKLASIGTEESLYDAVKMLKHHRIHRLPVIQDGNLLTIITHSYVLSYMVQNIDFSAPIFHCSIENLGIGTYKDVITVTKDTKLYVILSMMAKQSVSAVPIVNESGVVIDVYSRYDVMYLAQAGEYNLDITAEAALQLRPTIPVYTCMKTDTFESVLRHLAKTRVHRLICVDQDTRVVGIVSISDIFQFFLQEEY